VLCCTLADLPGVTKANKAKGYEDATHEITVVAIDPSYPQNLFEGGGIQVMMPENYCVQFVCDSDEVAAAVTAHMAQMLCDGRFPAESSGVRGVRGQFELAVLKAAFEEAHRL
jgi:hypothetical protein